MFVSTYRHMLVGLVTALKIHISEECHRKLVDSGGHVTSLRGQIDIQVVMIYQ